MYRKLVYICYVVLLSVQTARTWHHPWGCWGKPCQGWHSDESKERPPHEWCSNERRHNWPGHHHCDGSSSDSSSQEDNEDVTETEEIEDNTQSSRNSEMEEDGGSYEFENSSTVTFTCLHGYCYHIANNTYPPTCPFQDRVPFSEYNNIALNVVAGLLGIRVWVDIRRNDDYGYYEWLELGGNYGTILNEATDNGGDCVVLKLGLAKSFSTKNCDDATQTMCIHRLREHNRSFCESYEEICGTTSKCYCYAAGVNFTCQSGCKDFVDDDDNCEVCKGKFAEYPEPTIALRFLSSKQIIYVTVENSLKLTYVNGNRQVYCFTDVYTPSNTRVRDGYGASEIKLVRTQDDAVTYSIKPRDLGPGSYWCVGFKYPDLEKVTSNTIIADVPGTYTTDFVLNLTVQLGSAYSFLPYNVHTKATQIVDDVIDYGFKSIRPAYVSELFNEGGAVNISFHLTTDVDSDTNEAYRALTSSLNSLGSEGVVVDALTNSKSCISATTIIDGIEITWPEVELGRVTPPLGVYLQSDGTSITRSCVGSFQTGAEWSEVQGEISSRTASVVTQALTSLRSSNKAAGELNASLKELIAAYEEYVAYDVYLIAEILREIAESGEEFDIDVYVENLNSVMNFEPDILEASQINLNATDTILYSFDLALISSISHKDEGGGAHNVSVTVAQNVFAQVTNLKANGIIGLAVYSEEGGYVMSNITRDVKFSDVVEDNLIFAVFLPPSLLQQILTDLQDEDEINFVTAIFLNGALFNSMDVSKTEDSLILSMFVAGFEAGYLQEPVPILFKPLLGETEEKHCGFWKYGVNEVWEGIFGFWSVDKYATYESAYNVCKFSHMTHFALLVNGVEDIVLNYISIIGCVLSILGIIGIFATALVSKSWREGSGTQILLHYSTAILIQMIVLLFSDLIEKKGRLNLCIFTGIIIHYTIISQFFWMLIISYLQYRKFVQVLVQEPERLVLKSCLFAWLTPIFFVAVIALSNIKSYHQHDTCYLSGLSLYLGLFLPIIAVISINVVLFVLIFKSVLYRKTQAYGVNKKLVGLKIKLAVILFFLMGFSWIFGLFAGLLKSLFLSYIFSISATVQGLVLYLYFVVCNKNTRKMWRRKVNQMLSLCNARRRLENEDTKSSSSTDDFKLKK